MASDLSYLSQDQKIGEPPSLSWSCFEEPKLRRFPPASFTFIEYLGYGDDGIVAKVEAEGHLEPLALKLVSFCYDVCSALVLIINSFFNKNRWTLKISMRITARSRESASMLLFLS